MSTAPTVTAPTVEELNKALDKKKDVEAGVLDYIQSFGKGKNVKRREQVVDMTWFNFLFRFLKYVGGPAVLAWIFCVGYLTAGCHSGCGSSQVQQVQVVAPPNSTEMTTKVIKSALAEATTVLKSADELRGQVKNMAKAEAPPPAPIIIPPPVAPKEAPKVVPSKPDPPVKPPSIWDINK